MSEKPILFKAEMVRAILDGRKTQTRRIIKTQPYLDGPAGIEWVDGGFRSSHGNLFKYPCGRVGDELWVKEAHYQWGYWIADGKTNSGMTKKRFVCDRSSPVLYSPPEKLCTNRSKECGYWKRNSLFMPRWASRIQLRITDVRVERVQDISNDDAMSEGVNPYDASAVGRVDAKIAFHMLWDSINGADENKRWSSNPYVWAIEFERIKP